MNKIYRLLVVEDTYGVRFHNFIISWLIKNKFLCDRYPKIRRLPAKKCNQALYRKIIGIVVSRNAENWKVLSVIDSEGRRPETAARQDILSHVKRNDRKRFRVVVVDPMHEAWACIGLGGQRRKCRSKYGAIEFIERVLNVK